MAGLELANLTVGQNLQAAATVALSGSVPREALQVTITSSDPSQALLSTAAHHAGSASIVVTLQKGPDFYVQGRGKSGVVKYTATAPGYAAAVGEVTLAPSGIVLSGPFGIGKARFPTTPGGANSAISVYPAVLDSSLNYVATQALSGGMSAKVNITSSNAAVGTIAVPALTINGGSQGLTTQFRPASAGETTLAVTAPAGFSTPRAPFTSVIAKVLALTFVMEDIPIGQNLQAGGNVGLLEPAPAGGMTVTITSEDPSRLLLSAKDTEKGSASLAVKIPAGESGGTFFLQALGGSGTAAYTASGPGYEKRTARVILTPAGFIIAGPNSIMRSGANPGFVTSLATGKPTKMLVYSVYLDPVTRRSSDITVQQLRGGIKIEIPVESGDAAVGTIASPVIIEGGTDYGTTLFTPRKAGVAALSVVTPAGYTASSNATSLKAIVTE